MRAVHARVKRHEAKAQRLLSAQRRRVLHEQLGDYYIVDTKTGVVVETHVDLEAKARELGLLKPWEYMET